jgi:hypothetical protein
MTGARKSVRCSSIVKFIVCNIVRRGWQGTTLEVYPYNDKSHPQQRSSLFCGWFSVMFLAFQRNNAKEQGMSNWKMIGQDKLQLVVMLTANDYRLL